MSSYYEKEPYRSPQVTHEIQNSVLRAYIWMFIGVLVSAATAYISTSFGLLDFILYRFPIFSMLLIIAQIAIAIGFSVSMYKFTATAMKIFFLLYAVTLGFSLSTLALIYTGGEVFTAFGLSALYFGSLVVLGYTVKTDLTKFSTIFMVGLIVLIISQLVMMFLNVPWATRLICIFGLILFTGLTVFDVQRLNKTMLYAQGQPVAQEKWGIYFAFQLYLDFINIFLYILRLLGGNSRSN